MKQKIKFLIASIMILFLSSCEKDLYEDSINNNSKKYIIQTINLNTYNKKPSDLLTFKNKLDNKKRISFESKIVYDSINNFYIDDENVRLIQSDNLESYTIGIKYENSDKIHNIVFDQNEEGDFDSYLVKYDFTSEELNTLSTDVLETKEIIYIPIEFDENGIMRFENPYGGLVCIQEWSTEYNMWANAPGGGNNPSPTSPTITGNFCQYISTDLSGGGSAPVETNNTGGNNSGYSGGGYNTGNNSNLNTTGGVYGNGGIDGTGIITSPVVVVVTHILLDFITDLTPTQLLWWNNPNNADAVDSISNYLLDIEADEEFVKELIDLAIENNATFNFDNTIDPANSLNFDTVQELQNYLNNFNNSVAINLETEDNGNNTKTSRFKFDLGMFAYLNVSVRQKLQAPSQVYSVENISSSISGLTLAMEWEQNDDDDLNVSGNIATVTFTGTLSINCFVDGIGVFFSDNVTIICSFNTTTGTLISSQLIGLE